jgi:hypothetical protein
MSRLGRWLFLSEGQISKEDAVDIAQAECARRCIQWWEPVRVHRHYGDWAVWTYADHRGGNVRVIVDRGTGRVKAVFGPTPR